MASPAMFTLISSDDERFEVTEAAANMSQTIRQLIEDGCADGGIPLPNVNAKILAKVLEYCNKHAAAAATASSEAAAGGAAAASSDEAAGGSSSSSNAASAGNKDGGEDLSSFDKAFIDVDHALLYDLLLAANYLEIKQLLDLAVEKVANMVRGKTPEQIRETFGIKNDFSPEEEAEIRKESPWAFE